jgi:hypothetical protein
MARKIGVSYTIVIQSSYIGKIRSEDWQRELTSGFAKNDQISFAMIAARGPEGAKASVDSEF